MDEEVRKYDQIRMQTTIDDARHHEQFELIDYTKKR